MNRYFVCGAMLALSACSSVSTVKTNSQALRSEIAQKDVELVAYKTGPVLTIGPTDGLFVGALVSTLASYDTKGEEPMPGASPTEVVGTEVLDRLKRAMNIRIAAETAVHGAVPSDLKTYQQIALTPYVFEVSMIRQMFAYRPTAWSTYQYSMETQVRLIRVADASVIWSERCNVASVSGNSALQVGKDDLKNPKRTEAVFRYAARQCSDQIHSALNKT